MQDKCFLPQDGCKLHSCEQTGGKHDCKVEDDASAVKGLAKVEPFSRRCVLAEVSVDSQVW